jgi:hypothetical protein
MTQDSPPNSGLLEAWRTTSRLALFMLIYETGSPAEPWILTSILDSHGKLAFTEFAGGWAGRLADKRRFAQIRND